MPLGLALGLSWRHFANALSTIWGSITGTLSNQTDLQSALDLKADISLLSSYVPYTGATADVDLGLFSLSATNGTLTGTLSLGSDLNSAIIIGDVTGNTRGSSAVDISGSRADATYVASGAFSTLVGYQNIASGSRSTAIGYLNTASFIRATAVGSENIASGSRSIAFGRSNDISGAFSSGFGADNYVDGDSSHAFGQSNTISGFGSLAFGVGNTVGGSDSIAYGNSTLASGVRSFTLGTSLMNPFDSSFATGDDTFFSFFNSTGFSINNHNPLAKIHSTGSILATDTSSLGSELVTNGNFSSGSTGWTLGTGWAVASGAANKIIAGTGTLTQSLAITAGNYYLVDFNITEMSAGGITVSLGGVTSAAISGQISGPVSNVKLVFKAVSTAALTFTPTTSDTSVLFIDNISVKQVSGGDITALGGFFGSSLKIKSGATVTDILSATATLDFPSIGSNSIQSLTITVTGAAAGDAVFLGPPSGLESGLTATGYVSSSNTVTIRVHNTSGGAVDPASATWRATVVKF